MVIRYLKSLPFLIAALWGVGTSAYLMLTTLGEGQAGFKTINSGGMASIIEVAGDSSFYGSQGVWGVALLILFALLYLSTALLALGQRYIFLVIVVLGTMALTLAAGFSIGFFYFPALYSVMIGLILLGLIKMILMTSRAFADNSPSK